MKTVAMRKAAKAKANGGPGKGKKKKTISKKPKTLTLRDSSGKVIQRATKNGKVVYGADADKVFRSGFKNFNESLKKGTIVKDQFGYKYTRPRKNTKGY